MGALFNKKEPQQEGDAHPLEDTARRLLAKLQLFHTVARAGEQARPLHERVLPSSALPLAWRQPADSRVESTSCMPVSDGWQKMAVCSAKDHHRLWVEY